MRRRFPGVFRPFSLSSKLLSAEKYITAPIFYVNSKPHLGHLYTTVMADALKRFYDLKQIPSKLSVGTDEHGLKIQQAAEKANARDTKAFCDTVSQDFYHLFKAANIDYSRFIRTTDEDHKIAVQHFWNRLFERGWIYKGYHEGWYSVSDETFVPDSQVDTIVRDGKDTKISRESGKDVEWTKEENYKFKLSEFRKPLIQWLEDTPNLILPDNYYNNILKSLKDPEQVQDLSISRLKSRVAWGIEVPNDPQHVIYVWMDALINYLTVAGYPWKDDKVPAWWPPTWHIVGKDIIKFHSIFWPAFLMAAGLPLPKKFISHGHWLIDNQKMSKSSGNGVSPYELMAKYGVDPIRYFLLRDGGIGNDPEFSLDMVHVRYKHDLAGHLGNLIMRSTSLKINPSGIIPTKLSIDPTQSEIEILKQCAEIAEKVEDLFERGLFADALIELSKIIQSLNKYWSTVEPWKFGPGDVDRLHNILFVSFEGIRIVGILLSPVMPTVSQRILDALKVPVAERFFQHAILSPSDTLSRKIEPAKALFPFIKK